MLRSTLFRVSNSCLVVFSYNIHIPIRNYAHIQKNCNYGGKSDIALQAFVSGIKSCVDLVEGERDREVLTPWENSSFEYLHSKTTENLTRTTHPLQT